MIRLPGALGGTRATSTPSSRARRRAAGEPGAIYRSRVGAHRRELDPLLRLLCRLVHAGTLRELGYR